MPNSSPRKGSHEPTACLPKVGLYGIGLDTYWVQFPDLQGRLLAYLSRIDDRISAQDVHLINAGLVDGPERAEVAASLFLRESVDLIFLFVSTYALSSTVLPVVQQVGVPVVILNLQPTPAIDYESFNQMSDRGMMTGEWLAHCQACAAPEIACVFQRAGIDYHLVTGCLEEDPVAWTEIGDWISALRVFNVLRSARIGILGHYYCGMLDVYSDLTLLSSVFGCHFELLEMCRLARLREELTAPSVQHKVQEFEKMFSVDSACSEIELERAARTACALDKLVEENRLTAMAYYYEGQPGNPYENIVTSVIAGSTLLTAKGVPVAGECEVKNVIAMKILDALGAGGSFSELYAMDFRDNIVLWGHDGPGHARIAQETIRLVPLPVYHGKPGHGLSIQMRVKHGPATMLSVVETGGGKVKLLVAEGEAVPGPTLDIGNTNSRYRYPLGARDFVNEWCRQGPAHHCAIGLGHRAEELKKLAALLHLEYKQIC